MQNLVVTFNIVAPFLMYMLFGVLLKRLGFMTPEFTDKLNRIVSGAILPIFNFYNFLQADLTALKSGGSVLYILLATLCMLVILVLLTTFIIKRNPGRGGAIVDTLFVNNSMVFGNAIALSMYGEGNFDPMLLAAAVLLPVYNGLVLPVIQMYGSKQAASENGSAGKLSAKKMLKDLCTNPLLIAVFLALIFSLLNIRLPQVVNTFLAGISGTLTPLIFMIMGARFTLEGFRHDTKDLSLCLILKLIVIPVVALALPLSWGYRDCMLLSVLLCFGSPSGVTTVPVSKSCGCDDQFAGEMVAVSSGLSMLTVFLWIFLFKTLGMM